MTRGRGRRTRAASLGLMGVGLGLCVATGGCRPRQVRELRKASDELGRQVARGDPSQVRTHVVPGVSAQVDVEGMVRAKRRWSKALADPREVRPEAVVFVGPEQPVRVVLTEEGWRFAEDPTDRYAQHTPRQALLALVRATRAERWDVVLQLAPRRYRLGLSEKDLEVAWTEGEHGEALRASRDRLAAHLADPIIADADEASLDMGQGHIARLEREGDRWVVVEF